MPFGITVVAGLGSVFFALNWHLRGSSSWPVSILVFGLVVLAFALWVAYAAQLGDLYDSRS